MDCLPLLSFSCQALVGYLGHGQYDKRFGGRLRFFSQRQQRWVLTLQPSPNRFVVFRVRRPPGPLHAVEMGAGGDDYLRFGFTGWYSEEQDVMDEAARLELEKMRRVS